MSIKVDTIRKKFSCPALEVAVGILWIAALGYGFTRLYHYEFKSGTTDYTAQQWPKGTTVPRHNNIFQLVMVVHPKCPCTRASLGELEMIMAQGQGKVVANLVFVQPKQFNEDWVKSELYKKAQKIPGVEVMIDNEGKQAKLFGGTTSGQIFLYNPKSELIFTGGITDSRGHAGSNIGETTVIALINHQQTEIKKTPFFGCLLNDKPIETSGEEQL